VTRLRGGGVVVVVVVGARAEKLGVFGTGRGLDSFWELPAGYGDQTRGAFHSRALRKHPQTMRAPCRKRKKKKHGGPGA